MTSLIAVKRCGFETKIERARERETLDNLITSSEQGALISTNVSTIIKNRAVLEEQATSKTPNEKLIKRSNENIQTCIGVIKTRMERLCATPDEITDVIDGINNSDYQSVTLVVLKAMARKNPGLHQKVYDQALKMVTEKSKQHSGENTSWR